VRAILGLSIYVPIMIMPVFTLFWIEVMFFPYQSHLITAWHVVLVIVDVLMIWVMWREVMQTPDGAPADTPSSARRRRNAWRSTSCWAHVGHGTAVLACAVSIALILTPQVSSLFPILGWAPWLDLHGEEISERGPAQPVSNSPIIARDALEARFNALRDESQAPDYFTSFVDAGALRAGGVRLAGRNLRSANLAGVSLIGADLTAADLTGADLRFSDLRGAVLRQATLDGAKLDNAHLEVADLTRATARGADLPFAQLQGAALHDTDLTGADLQGAHLQFVRFMDPMPTRAELADSSGMRPPKLRGAILWGAQLQGSPLEGYETERGIDARAADLRGAQMQGVNLRLFDLSGANLAEVTLSGDQSVICGNPDLYATCGTNPSHSDQPGSPANFAQLCYDAARIVTIQTWSPISRKLRELVKVDAGYPNYCFATPAASNIATTISPRAAADFHSYIKVLADAMKKPEDWCDEPARMRICMRAFAFEVYDSICEADRKLLPGSAAPPALREEMRKYTVEVRPIFDAAGIAMPDFDPLRCIGSTPKDVRALFPQSQPSEVARIVSGFLDILTGATATAEAH